jgi:hypothetical protein
VLPAREHDALNRLLRTLPLSTRVLLAGTHGLVAGFRWTLGTPGCLVPEDVVLEKPFAKRPPWAACTYSFAFKRKVYGCHIVLLSCTRDPTGRWRIPVAFRLWRPKRTCAPGRYHEEDGTGGDDAARGGRRRLPGRLSGGRHHLHRGVRP